MDTESVLSRDWSSLVDRLGGPEVLTESARQTKAFVRARVFDTAADLLRMILAYCLGRQGLRLTTAWASSVGLIDISNVSLLYRLRQSGDWLSFLVGQILASAAPKASQGRLIRLIDATTVPKPGTAARTSNKLWRIHSAFDLPSERFGCFELTDEHGGERLDRLPVVAGEIRIGDRVYLQPERIAPVLEAGADIILRAGWRNARWLDADRMPVDLLAAFGHAKHGIIDRPIWLGCKKGTTPPLRLIAIKKPAAAAEAAQRKARKASAKAGHHISNGTLIAAQWVILVTSLTPETFSTTDVLALYRLRWRIELGFKRLKSIIGLNGPPGRDERSAKPYILAHLLAILLLEPLVDELEDSPHWATAA